MPIARLRYVGSTRLWTVYYYRRTGPWERYPLLGPIPALTTRPVLLVVVGYMRANVTEWEVEVPNRPVLGVSSHSTA
jgi:hypothetical protein